MSQKLSPWTKAALLTTGAASAFNVLLWALGATLADAAPGWTVYGALRVVFGAISFVSMDLVVVVVVLEMRAGRRGPWAEIAAAVAALAAALFALDVAQVIAWPWLHAAPAVVLYTFMRHVAAPEWAGRRAQLARERDALAHELAQLSQERDALSQDAGRAWDAARAAQGELGQLRDALSLSESDASHWRAMAAQAASRPALVDGGEVVQIGTRAVTLRALARELWTNKTSLGRAVARAQEGGDGGTD